MATFTGLTSQQEDILYAWVTAGLANEDITILWSYPNELRPDKDYAVINVVDGVTIESAPSLKYDSLDTFKNKFHKTFTFSVNFFSNNNNNYIQQLEEFQYTEESIEILGLENITCRRSEPVVLSPEEKDVGFEYKAVLDFIMAFGTERLQNLGEINSVEITENVTNKTFVIPKP